jgi:hypothetical protein
VRENSKSEIQNPNSDKPDEKIPSDFGFGISEFSNSIQLTGGQWAFVGIFTLAMILFTPSLWKQVQTFEPATDYRIPHELSNDYWLYDRWSRLATEQYDWLLIGDSVIWGEYVTPNQTLSHYLNDRAGGQRFANLGLDGADPVALAGLVEHYAQRVASKNVLLHCNPLWMSSPRRDYQDEKYFDPSHSRLLPQFSSRIPGYKEDISTRLGIMVERRVPFSSWTSHLQTAYFGGTDIPNWTREHPYENPVEPITKGLPSPDESLRHLPIPWFKSGIPKQDYPWIELTGDPPSLQWEAFQRTVRILQQRGNHVFVMIGPFNEHLLEPESLERYQEVKTTIVNWLEDSRVAYLAPAALPSDLYGDASHPLAAGYANLAEHLIKGGVLSPQDNPRS